MNSPDLVPIQVQNVGIDDHAGQALPKGLMLKDEAGQPIAFDSLFDGKKPVVVVLAYYSCPMLCTVVLNGITTGLRQLDWSIGREFRVVTVSIDPHDTPEIAHAKRLNYVRDYGRPVEEGGWQFLTGSESSVRTLADALGFRYHWDAAAQQYAHAAGAFVLTPDARISRTLYGVGFPPKDLRLALIEASKGAYTSAIDKLLLFCFHYEPNSGKYVVAAMRLMKVGGGLTALAVGLWLARFWWRDSHRAASAQV
jgi:protein SCO1/2